VWRRREPEKWLALGVEEWVRLEAADQAADDFWCVIVRVLPENGARKEARDEGLEGFGVKGVWVGHGEEEGVDPPEGRDVLLRERHNGCARGK
jgi:hypothetical protein